MNEDQIYPFQPGAIIVPAQDGTLASLGYDVAGLNLDALGVVLERASRRALVNFPEIKKTMWLDFSEMADVFVSVDQGDKDYESILPNSFDDLEGEKLIWILHWLMNTLPLVKVLELEVGSLSEVWDPCQGETIEKYYSGDLEQQCCRLSLGLSSLSLELQKKSEEVLSKRLLFTQIKPSGMHKFEAALYVKV